MLVEPEKLQQEPEQGLVISKPKAQTRKEAKKYYLLYLSVEVIVTVIIKVETTSQGVNYLQQ